jgi:predicted acyl esterase
LQPVPVPRAWSPIAVLAVLAGLLLAVPPPAMAAPNGYVTMSDGTSIAINVRMPDTYQEGKRYPTIFEMSGYDGGSATGRTLSGDIADQTGATFLPLQDDSRQLTKFFNNDYITIHASIRGTGARAASSTCSRGAPRSTGAR